MPRLDLRAWNLFAGLTLAAGCTAAPAQDTSTETGSTNSTTGETTDETTTDPDPSTTAPSSTTSDDECEVHDDCPPSSLCNPHSFECELFGPLDGCEPSGAEAIPLALDGAPLGLSFADLDDDGAAELVVVTADSLEVFESGSDVPSSSPRDPGSPSLVDVVSGPFDDAPGEDLALATQDQLIVHSADGVAGFGPAQPSPSTVGELGGLAAALVDGEGELARLLGWGNLGATLLSFGPGTSQGVWGEAVSGGSVRGPGSDDSVLVVRSGTALRLINAGGSPVDSLPALDDRPSPVVAVAAPDNAWLDLDTVSIDAGTDTAWTALRLFRTKQLSYDWSTGGALVDALAADFDGNGADELVLLFDDGAVRVILNLGGNSECELLVASPEGAAWLAVGDWDGDGDEELAIAGPSGELLIHDAF